MTFKYSFLGLFKKPQKGIMTINDQLKIEANKIDILYKSLNFGISLKLLNNIYSFAGFSVALCLSILFSLYLLNLNARGDLGPLMYLLFFMLMLCVLFSTLSVRIKMKSLAAACRDYFSLRSFRSDLHAEHNKFVSDYKALELNSTQMNKDISDEIHSLSAASSDRINDLTKNLISAIRMKANREEIFKVIYNGSHVSNSFTKVLNIGATTAFIFENK